MLSCLTFCSVFVRDDDNDYTLPCRKMEVAQVIQNEGCILDLA